MHVSWLERDWILKLYEDHIVIYLECEQIADTNGRVI